MVNDINRIKDKKYMIISIDAEKPYDKIQHRFMVKALNKLSLQGAYHNILKAVYDKPIAIILVNGERLIVFPLRLLVGKRPGCPLSSLLVYIVLETSTRAIA